MRVQILQKYHLRNVSRNLNVKLKHIMTFRSIRILTISLTILLMTLVTAQFQPLNAQDNEPLTEEMRGFLKSEAFNVGFLLQSEALFTLEENNILGEDGFGLGPTRLRFDGMSDGGFSYEMDFELRRSPTIWDASIGYRSSDAFGIETGMHKADIGLDLQPGPGKIDFIDRARLISLMTNRREVGVSATGQFDQFDYTVGVYNGTGRNLQNDGNLMYLLKGGYTFEFDNGGSLYVVANGAYNGTVGESIGILTTEGDRLVYGGYVDYESDSWFGAAELLLTSFESIQLTEKETITGAYITLGNHITEKDELLARWDYIGYDLLDTNSSLYILGWNHQFTSVMSFQVNALAQFEESEEYFGLQGNLQYEF